MERPKRSLLVPALLLCVHVLALPSVAQDPVMVNVTVEFLMEEYRVRESLGEVFVGIFIASEALTDTPVNLTITTMEKVTTNRAIAMKDYSSVEYNVVVLPNEVRDLDLTFIIHNDDIAEPCEERFAVSIFSNSPSVDIPVRSCATIVILDDDDPIVTFIGGPLTVSEAQGQLEVTLRVEKLEGIPLNITFTYEPAEGQVSPFLLSSSSHLIPSAGLHNFTLPLVNNAVYEGLRQGNLTASYFAVRPCPSQTVETSTAVTIREDDTTRFVFTQVKYSFREDAGRVEVTVVRVGEATVPVTASVIAVNGSAEEGKDFFLLTTELVFLPQEQEKIVAILIEDDSVFERDESFTLYVFFDQPLGGGAELTGAAAEGSTEVVVLNDDAVTVEFEEESYTAPEADVYVNITVVLLGNSSAPVTVRIIGEYEGADGFSVLNFTLEVEPKMATVVPIFVGVDGVYNPNAKWVLRLESVLGSEVVIGQRSQTEIKIHETDTLQATFTARAFAAAEGDRRANVSVQLLGRSAVPITLRITPFGLNTSAAATEDVDFSTSPVDVTVPPGGGDTTTSSASLVLFDDSVLEGLESFGAMLTSDISAVTVVAITITRVDIEDDDSVMVGFTVGTVTVMENVGKVNICVAVTGQRAIPVTVLVTTPTTSEVTATRGLDVSSNITMILTLAPGVSVQCLEVDVLEDSLEEETEVLVIQVDSLSPVGTVIMGQETVRLIVMDNDATVVPDNFLVCRVTAEQVTPFHAPLSPSNAYPLGTPRCEHVIFTSSSDSHVFEVLADMMQGTTFGFRQAGIRLDDLLVLIDDAGEIENIDVLGTPLAVRADETEYPGGIFLSETASGFRLRFSEVDVRVGINGSRLVVEVANDSSLVAEGRGLCGDLDGVLRTPEGLIFVTPNDDFVSSWKALTFSLPTRAECRRNATVTGDPVFSVPLHMSTELIDQVNKTQVSLCFELRGRPDVFFNLISDQCLSVNTHYAGSIGFTYMDQISVLAPGRDGQCREVTVDINGCQATVDGQEVSTYSESGVVLRKLRNRVYISVPNCHELPTAMWVTCTTERRQDILHFRVARGGNLAPISHGIIGQFWNVPVTVEYFNVSRDGYPLFIVSVAYPDAPVRSFVAELLDWDWESTAFSCLYAGNGNAGPTAEYQRQNDAVIMGDYMDYPVQSMFDHSYTYSQFESSCALEQT